MKISALLIDLDGVLRHWPGSYADLESSHGLPAGTGRRIGCRTALRDPARATGEPTAAASGQRSTHPIGRDA